MSTDEILQDVYDINYNKIGKIRPRGTKLDDGEHFLSTHVWIVNSKGEFLIQKRSANKKIKPNMWSVSGGCADLGETSLECAVRETYEEIGVMPKLDNIKHVMQRKEPDEYGYLDDVWIVFQDFELSDVVMQPTEVSDVKWASIEEIKEMIKNGEFADNVVFALENVMEVANV